MIRDERDNPDFDIRRTIYEIEGRLNEIEATIKKILEKAASYGVTLE